MLSRTHIQAPLALTLVAAMLLCPGRVSAQPAQCGDLNSSGSITTSDALLLLKGAVGQDVDLICDQCGSTCVGDPRYLLGQWAFDSEFDEVVYEDNYFLFAVDEAICDIVGQDLDDLGFVYAYASTEYDYVLFDLGDNYCDVFLFDYVDRDHVEGINILADLDENGYCDFESAFDEGPMVGERIAEYEITTASARTASAMVGPRRSKAATTDARTSAALDPKVAAALQQAKERYSKQPRR